MILTPGGTSEHVMRVLKQYTSFQAEVRAHLPGLSAAHGEDIADELAKASPGLPSEIASMTPDAASVRIRGEVQALAKGSPWSFEGPPLGQHLLRLFLTATPWHDRAQIASTIDRMDVESKRRLAVEIKRKLASEGKVIPEPRDTDGNIAHGRPGVEHHAARKPQQGAGIGG